MPLSWNEIKSRALQFTQEWKDERSEDAEAKVFLEQFFNVFGINRRKVASFEHKVKKLNEQDGYIDLFWKGVILIEMKSRGKNLDKAYQQAKEYLHNLPQHELPKYILISDFENLRLYDQDEDKTVQFKLPDLVNNVQHFGFISGYEKKVYKEQDPANIKAAEVMGKLHDSLKDIGYEGHSLEVYLVRLLFCLFAEDTNILDKQQFQDYIEQRTHEDGSDLASKLHELFQVLNTPSEKRLKNLDEQLKAFPYVNGKLFEEPLPTAGFDAKMRQSLLDCCYRDWSKISPAIFGSMFQSIMNDKARRNLGAHYTSEKNILKLIKPLFLDELGVEFNSVKDSKQKLKNFHDKISRLRFLDPACGCGNFLIIAYRELRLLEIEIIKQRLKLEGYREEVLREAKMDVGYLVQCDVDKFYGIEYEEFPAQIAQVAMWLADHQMNQLVSNTFGEYYVRLPLRKSATIKHGNALRTDWQSLIDPLPFEKGQPKYDYILGNPPFIGSKFMSDEQRVDIENLFKNVKGAGTLDYVSGWYIKAAKYMQEYNFMDQAGGISIEQPLRRTLVPDNNTQPTKTAFVSTNSISQGEQVGILWNELFNKYKIKIHFAHRTFSWSNEARGNAAVHVVIIGFGNFNVNDKALFEYEHVKAEPHEIKARNINPYLVEAQDVILSSRQKPFENVPEIGIGNKPIDGGHYLFTENDKEEFLKKEPKASKYFYKWIGSHEFINGYNRWCLYVGNAQPGDLKSMPEVLKRIDAVRHFRLASSSLPTIKLADTPTKFHVQNIPDSPYLVVPKVSSERRKYIPIGYIDNSVLSSDLLFIIKSSSLYQFGVLASAIHMTWVKYTCGRLKSDFRYSKDIVYNNFPWPENPNEKQVQAVEAAAQNVLDARAQFPNASLADLYDPNTMPPVLVKAHQALDKAVDLCYRLQPFINETKRIEFLFELYDKYTSGMFVNNKKKTTKTQR